MSTFLADLERGLRAMARSPRFVAVAVLTLGLGMGASSAIWKVVDSVLLRPLPYPGADRIVHVWNRNLEQSALRWGVSLHDFEDWRARNRVFEEIAAFDWRDATLASAHSGERVGYAIVTPGFFRVLGVEPVVGRTFLAEENEPGRDDVAILGYGLWQRLFGGEQERLGETVELDGRALRVVGVMPSGFAYPAAETALWKPIGMRPDDAGERSSYWVTSVARLLPGVSIARAQNDLDRIMSELAVEYPESNAGIGAYVEPQLDAEVGHLRPTLAMLSGAVGLVLLIACSNVAHLLLARGVGREREMAVRASLGASRRRLACQLLAESVGLALLGGAAALGVAFVGLRLLPLLGGGTLPRSVAAIVDLRVVLFTLLLAPASGLLFGLAPAWLAGRRDLHASLRVAASTDVASAHRLRSLLVVTELALAIVVLVAAGLLARSLARVLEVDPGIESERLLSFRLEPPQRLDPPDGDKERFVRQYLAEQQRAGAFYSALAARLESLPGIERASAVNRMPLAGNHWYTEFAIEGRPPVATQGLPRTYARVVLPGYFETLGVLLLSGRALGAGDSQDALPVAVINEAMARHWGEEDPIGRRITIEDPTNPAARWLRVVGVVGNVHHDTLEASPHAILYTPFLQSRFGHFGDWGMDVVVRTEAEPLAQADAVRAAVAALDPRLPIFEIRSMEEVLRSRTAARRFQLRLLLLFAALALVMAAVGVYGVLAFMVDRRAPEMSIRSALGARSSDLARLVLVEAARLVALGVGLGLLAAPLCTRLMSRLVYGVRLGDPVTSVLAALLLVGVALLASLVPAYRQARRDPIVALRCD